MFLLYLHYTEYNPEPAARSERSYNFNSYFINGNSFQRKSKNSFLNCQPKGFDRLTCTSFLCISGHRHF